MIVLALATHWKGLVAVANEFANRLFQVLDGTKGPVESAFV